MVRRDGSGPGRVVLLGDANVDLLLDVDGLPEPGGDAVADRQHAGLGGSAANTAVLLSRFGAACTMLSCVGRDRWGDLALEELRGEGVETSHVVRHHDEPTSLNVVAVTPDGERTMFAYRGASARLAADEIGPDLVGAARALHLSGYAFLEPPQRDAARTALRIARDADVLTSLDVPVPAARAAREDLREALPGLDLLVTGLPEARLLTGERDGERCASALLRLGVRTVAMKLGADGALVATADERARARGLPVHPVDTTGAGDAFAAGAIAALLAGQPVDVVGTIANACGASATEVRGAGRGLPALAAVRALLEDVERHPANGAAHSAAETALALLDRADDLAPGPSRR